MASNLNQQHREAVLSMHSKERWDRRKRELDEWIAVKKERKMPKKTRLFEGVPVDEQLYLALVCLQQAGIRTEYSCAGVSPLDEPEEHSLYAYVTFYAEGPAKRFTEIVLEYMKHRAVVTYEPEKNRYDVSSFFIGHNRSFCLLLEAAARRLMEEVCAAQD
ncbi:hypothetical protein [Marinicrinis lubricantis]|uniref:Uncharacterized protein n=1 Tax=Marinicrinis lubricantis TaxID=2086470 RepID=A0ABW1IK86_9BACL